MHSKKEKRVYKRYHPSNPKVPELIPVEYTLWFDEKEKLVEVRNEHMVEVEKTSECFEYFDNKYNNL